METSSKQEIDQIKGGQWDWFLVPHACHLTTWMHCTYVGVQHFYHPAIPVPAH
jgi:hypothetical protein